MRLAIEGGLASQMWVDNLWSGGGVDSQWVVRWFFAKQKYKRQNGELSLKAVDNRAKTIA